ncbi:MAG: hypothetical protein AB1424_01645 [Thermodesulfobacteriota bacterium]
MLKTILTNKAGIITGFIIAFLLLSYNILPEKDEVRRATWLSAIGLSMIFAVLIGGIISGFIVEKYVINKSTKAGQTWGGIAGSVLISPLSIYYGIASSSLGVVVGAMVSSSFGIGYYGVYIGIFISIASFIIITECIGAITGAFIGAFLQNIIERVSQL